MNRPLISIIVPIYNVEEYLNCCIQSIVDQTYRNLEIILVDDGSPDSCPAICDIWAATDRRIRVIHKENGGLSDARNSGIRIATGDYLIFLDSDDFWDNRDAIAQLVGRIEKTNSEVLSFPYKKFYTNSGEKKAYFTGIPDMPLKLHDKAAQLSYIVGNGLYIASAWNKLIKRSLFDNDLYFRIGVTSEDIEWCAKLLIYANSVDFVCNNFYCYRQREDSITHTIHNKNCKDLCENIIRCFNLAENASAEIRGFLYQYIAYQYGTFFLVQAQADQPQKNSIQILNDFRWVLKYHHKNWKLILLHIACKIIGFPKTCGLIRYLYGCRYER